MPLLRISVPILLLLSAGSGWLLARPGSQDVAGVDIQVEEGPNPWNHLNFRNQPENFQFAIVADLTGRERPSVFAYAVKMLNLLQPEFVVSIGDIIEGHTNDPKELDRDWKILEEALEPLEMPFFYLAGNHDYYYATAQTHDKTPEVYDMAAKWEEHAGRSYYHFLYRNTLFLLVNACIPDQEGNDRQYEYFSRVLAENPNVRWSFIFFHYPLWRGRRDNVWKRMEPHFSGRGYTVFGGNNHEYIHYERFNRDYIQVATTGGMSRIRGPEYGEFDHLMWVTMTDEGPRIVNLMLDGLFDKHVMTELSHRLTNRLRSRPPVTSKVVVLESSAMDGTSSRLKLINEADLPLRVLGTFEPHSYLRPQPQVFERVVPPKSEEAVDLSIQVEHPVAVHELRPLVMKWEAIHELADQRDVRVKGKNRIVIDLAGPRPRPAEALINDDFSGPILDPAWVILEAGGRFNGRGQYSLQDTIRIPDRLESGIFTDGRGKYTLNSLWHLPMAGLYRDIPAGTFEAHLRIGRVQWAGDMQIFRWEFWDDPDQAYRYGPYFRSASIVTLSRENEKPFIEVGTDENYTSSTGTADEYKRRGIIYLPENVSEVALRANWRESTKSWSLYYGTDGAEATSEIPGGSFKVERDVSPDGKRNLIFVRQAEKETGFSVELDSYQVRY